MSDARKRADRIRKEVSILRVLSDYGYEVEEFDREQQFSCDFHGMGDSSPSARVYPESNDWHCFGCGKSRDAISTVMEKEGIEFWEACYKLEKRYDLPIWKSTWTPRETKDPRDIVKVSNEGSFDEDKERTENLLLGESRRRSVPAEPLLSLWERFDKVSWKVHQEEMSEKRGRERLAVLREEVIDLVAKSIT